MRPQLHAHALADLESVGHSTRLIRHDGLPSGDIGGPGFVEGLHLQFEVVLTGVPPLEKVPAYCLRAKRRPS